MRDRRVLQDSVPEIEDVWSCREGVKHAVNGLIQRLSTGNQRQGVEVALDRHALRQLAGGPERIDRLVDADRVDAGFTGISRKLAASTLREPDHRDAGMSIVKRGG